MYYFAPKYFEIYFAGNGTGPSVTPQFDTFFIGPVTPKSWSTGFIFEFLRKQRHAADTAISQYFEYRHLSV